MPPESIIDELRRIRDSQSRIEQAVLGDVVIGVPGLVKRTGALEGKVKSMQDERLRLAGMIIGASSVVSLVIGFAGWLLAR